MDGIVEVTSRNSKPSTNVTRSNKFTHFPKVSTYTPSDSQPVATVIWEEGCEWEESLWFQRTRAPMRKLMKVLFFPPGWLPMVTESGEDDVEIELGGSSVGSGAAEE